MTSVSAGHIILTPTQPVWSARPQRESNPGPPQQEWRALPTELLRPPLACRKVCVYVRERERERERDRQTDRQTYRQRQTETETHRETQTCLRFWVGTNT